LKIPSEEQHHLEQPKFMEPSDFALQRLDSIEVDTSLAAAFIFGSSPPKTDGTGWFIVLATVKIKTIWFKPDR